MNHSFDVDIAVKYGIIEAILIDDLAKSLIGNKLIYTEWSNNYLKRNFNYITFSKLQKAIEKLERLKTIKVIREEDTNWVSILDENIYNIYSFTFNYL